jgi:hypothetical protein
LNTEKLINKKNEKNYRIVIIIELMN